MFQLDTIVKAHFRPETKISTSCRNPWALVRIPTGTQFAFVTEWLAEHGKVYGFKAYTFNSNGRQMQAKPRTFDFCDLLKDWDWYNKPSYRQLQKVKRKR